MEDIHRKEKNEIEAESTAKNGKNPSSGKKQPTQKQEKKNSKPPKKKSLFSMVNWKWVITAFLSSLVISIILSLLSAEVLSIVHIIAAVLILLAFVFLGIIFDIIGLAVATANEKPFNSMASQKIKAGKTGLALIRKADQVSSFCNDVIGDICGVVSGSAAATVALRLAQTMGIESLWVNLLLCGLVSAITVGGKAIGKGIGLNYSVEIVTLVAKFLAIFSREPKKNKNKAKNKKTEKDTKEDSADKNN
ncbi:MAG: Mg2+ and Co2+ transporter CorB [Clostridia bacterium]|nr:Mg2+ and Co2+ transporter CorB [Clostridia bacterium]